MKKEEVLQILHEHEAELRAQGVKSLYLFGSVARGDNRPDSDADFLVEFTRMPTLFDLGGLYTFLSQLLRCEIDLGTADSLRPEFRDEVMKEAIRAA